MVPWIWVKEEIDDNDDEGITEQAGAQRINSQVERQPSETTKLILLKHEARGKRMRDKWRGCTRYRKVYLTVCSFLNKKTMVILDKMWELRWIWVGGSGEWEQSYDRISLPFEPMVSQLRLLPGDLGHLIPKIQFLYCVVTAQIGISALWYSLSVLRAPNQ